jgi:hypothetical protein
MPLNFIVDFEVEILHFETLNLYKILTVFQISFEILEEEGTDVLGHAEISLSHR